MNNNNNNNNSSKNNGRLKGPLRLTRLCALCIILPGCLIAGPLYLRYRVYSGQIYPVGMSDMRLVDNRISTTWCQKQLVKSNATFNAYLLPNEPQMKKKPIRVSMIRHLNLQDDMKEYWGFYLLKGSSFTVSTCCRWPGAFLTVIKGHKQLKECAYFGDDSSEEEDELEELEKDEEDAISNEPWMMKKARPGVIFHGSQLNNTLNKHRLSKEIVELDNGNEHNFYQWIPRMRSEKFKSEKKKIENNVNSTKSYNNNNNNNKSTESINLRGNFENLNTTEEEEKDEVKSKEVEEAYQEVLEKLKKLKLNDKNILLQLQKNLRNKENLNESGSSNNNNNNDNNKTRDSYRKKRELEWHGLHEKLNKNDEDYDTAAEEIEEPDILTYEDLRGTFNETTVNDKSDSEFWSSFSSSEERLINCAGLIINLPLIPKKGCQANKPEKVKEEACAANKFTYKVPINGYYFFVLSSENEIQTNYIRIQFEFDKILYNVSNPVAACTNTTESCSLPLNFFSWEKTVLEMPLTNNDSMWNQEFIVVSVCEPRTIVYAACVVAVPILILLCAF
ncbi:conserved hypothetical protein [Pediculus humanus corporis]|uniref:E3 ubiquitin-protein ligase APD1-4 N-terminal domain-containing protein n=1 Tax=Pediculus humanus subsp. corporis TaxID=121224 RepID=E0VAI5_PEDHC|nr:uncharacterized protein Phum_PHUM039060 [Pediculus humanus corporis]EEB10391.1 conserved hypothetical protein [Pediculus humanus corporis]